MPILVSTSIIFLTLQLTHIKSVSLLGTAQQYFILSCNTINRNIKEKEIHLR
jgi:hypothetical protein